MYDVTMPIPSCASGKDVCIVCVSVCLYRYRHWMVYDRVLQKRFQLPLVATTKSIDFENSPTVGGNDRTSAAHVMLAITSIARKLGFLGKNATLRIGHQMKRQNSFYVVDVKCLLELQLLLNCPAWGLQHCSQGVNLEEQELVICDNLKVCRVFIQESQIVLLVYLESCYCWLLGVLSGGWLLMKCTFSSWWL